MHVLVCPVCQGQMQEINKGGVAIDVCQQCRGIWLDRGELEKLSSMVDGASEARFLPDRPRPDRADYVQRREDYRRRDRDDDDEDDDDDDRRGRRGGLFGQSGGRRRSLLDFFD